MAPVVTIIGIPLHIGMQRSEGAKFGDDHSGEAYFTSCFQACMPV